MAVALAVLAVIAFGLMFVYGNASFSPAGPSDGQAPTADVTGGLTRAAPLVGFPVIIPGALPDGWHPNSFTFTQAPGSSDQPPAVRAGWLTDQGRYITFVQSGGHLAQVQSAELGTVGSATGTEDVDDASWTVVPGRRSEVAWVRSVGDVTYLITGTAQPEDFRTLAAAVDNGTAATS
jgi:hypothetical protein